MEDTLNKALDMGWRFLGSPVEFDFSLRPPDSESRKTKMHYKKISLLVPLELPLWLEKHTIISPDEKKRDELAARVINWFNLKWPSYYIECDGDEAWAIQVILEDAVNDFSLSPDDAEEWFGACDSSVPENLLHIGKLNAEN